MKNTKEVKKAYTASIEIRQKNDIDGVVRKVFFDFGDDILAARQFVQSADESLTRHDVCFEVIYTEVVKYEG